MKVLGTPPIRWTTKKENNMGPFLSKYFYLNKTEDSTWQINFWNVTLVIHSYTAYECALCQCKNIGIYYYLYLYIEYNHAIYGITFPLKPIVQRLSPWVHRLNKSNSLNDLDKWTPKQRIWNHKVNQHDTLSTPGPKPCSGGTNQGILMGQNSIDGIVKYIYHGTIQFQ